ncbi:hypothetical protein [Micromonospora sp. WMMD712]|uniref:hypothetical protein n=1 Tax=Micromonospora sp. WMMD712 TaxID=3016096 RepID=UPI00249A6B12|nr:hypothetical protein [Micromonospora sp. WMMD712]WFE55669.1 hypothetical protein O7633_01815 [Micromonospora sp. WMMD712]
MTVMIYATLERAIRSGSPDRVAELVRTTWLDPIANGESTLSAVRHPLGFACLPVLRDGRQGVCVHLFGERRTPVRLSVSPFHCHSWDLLSHVLYGQVGNQHVTVATGSTYRVFDTRTTAGGDRLVPTTRTVDATAGAPEHWAAGSAYELAAGHFHASTVVGGAPAATVVLGLHHPEKPDLTLGALDTPAHRLTRRLHGRAETVSLARTALDRLTRDADRLTPAGRR